MPTAVIDEAPARASGAPADARLGWLLSGIAILFLGTDAGAKLLVPAMMAAYAPSPLKIPSDPGFYRLLGSILAFCTALYAIPRTAVPGAVPSPTISAERSQPTSSREARLSATRSSAITSASRSGAVWGGLWLHEPRLRRLLPLS